jgi:hypothetical protein
MGGVQRIMDSSNGSAVGTYTREPAAELADRSLPDWGPLCAGCGGIIVGDYLVTYEIRLAPLPDMHPKSMRVQSPGGHRLKSARRSRTSERVAAEAYGMIFTIDGDRTSQISGRLAVNQSQEHCVHTAPLGLGSHSLAVTIGPEHAIPESDESNNELRGPWDCTAEAN